MDGHYKWSHYTVPAITLSRRQLTLQEQSFVMKCLIHRRWLESRTAASGEWRANADAADFPTTALRHETLAYR